MTHTGEPIRQHKLIPYTRRGWKNPRSRGSSILVWGEGILSGPRMSLLATATCDRRTAPFSGTLCMPLSHLGGLQPSDRITFPEVPPTDAITLEFKILAVNSGAGKGTKFQLTALPKWLAFHAISLLSQPVGMTSGQLLFCCTPGLPGQGWQAQIRVFFFGTPVFSVTKGWSYGWLSVSAWGKKAPRFLLLGSPCVFWVRCVRFPAVFPSKFFHFVNKPLSSS